MPGDDRPRDYVLLYDKPAGVTSHDVVATVRRGLARTTKVGHAGTLDPFATGLLLVLVGRATRVQRFLMAHGDPSGACFPSAHVAGAWASVLTIRELWGRRAFLAVLVPTIGLTVAVVYTRYHYLTDAFGGLVIALVAAVVARRLMPVPVPADGVPAGALPA